MKQNELRMKSVLIVYATREGQTRKVATQMGKRLSELGARVVLHDARDPFEADLSSVDLLVCGGSMHAGGVEPELVRWIAERRALIEGMPRAFFLVLLSAATRDPELRERWLEDARKKAQSQIGVDFGAIEMIAGALRYSKYPLPLKWVMRSIAKKAGEDTDVSKDYEYTDWKGVDAYAEGLLKLPPLCGT